jgi:hypothetical protein
MYLSLFLYVFPCINLSSLFSASLCSSIYLSLYVDISVSICLSVEISVLFFVDTFHTFYEKINETAKNELDKFIIACETHAAIHGMLHWKQFML